jgi:hypothetical protein
MSISGDDSDGATMTRQAGMREIVRSATPAGPKNYSRTPQYIDPESDRYRAIVQDLQAGTSFYRVARNHNICVNTARRIAHHHGIVRDDPKTHAAVQARRSYAHAERIRLLDLAFERLEMLLDDVQDTKSLQQLCNALALLIDKRRLMDGEVTERTEIVRDDSARESLLAKLDTLVARSRSQQDRA